MNSLPDQDKPEALPPFVGVSERRAAPLAPSLSPDERIGLAVVGLGRLSIESILPALQSCKFARLAGMMTGDKEKGTRLARQYGVSAAAVYGYDDWDALASNRDIAAVYIVTPNGIHREQVERAAAAGKHVLCEKPMANTSAEAEAMIAACKARGVTLMIAYRCQFEPHQREAIRIARSTEFGALKLIEAHNGQVQDTAPQWRHDKRLAGGGALPDIGIYCLSFARYVTGEEPSEVMAWAWSTPGDPRFREIEENVAWQMRFPSGVVAKLSCAYDAHESRIARLHFERAVVKLDPAFSYKGLRLSITHRAEDREDVEITEERVMAEPDQFGTEIDHFAECILTGKPPMTPGEEGLQDQRIMEAIYTSASKNRTVALDRIDGIDVFRGH